MLMFRYLPRTVFRFVQPVQKRSVDLLKYYRLLQTAAVLFAASMLMCFVANAVRNTMSPDDIRSLDNTCTGYGQGRDTDENNRPLGALDFNRSFGKYGAYALAENSGKHICLTFDQGYENGYTAKILDTLKEKGIKAVFFITGDYAKREHELVQRMIDEGHVIGNHGMKHASLPSLSYEEAEKEISSLHGYVKDNYGYEMKLFRPPCGEYSEQKLALVQSLGYKTLFWSFAYCDWDVNKQPDRKAALERTFGAAHDGAVYLLHSVSETNCSILPELIDRLRNDGYEFSVPQTV